MFQFSAKAVHMVSHYMAQQDIRYYLNGIYAEPAPGGGAFLVGTDGHQMAVFYDADALCTGSVLFQPTKAAIAACKPSRRSYKKLVQINPETQRLMVWHSVDQNIDPHEELYIQPGKCFVDGKFPEWKRVFKPFANGAACESICVNAAYLAKFHTAIKAHVDSRTHGVSMFFKSETDAIVLTNDTLPEFHVLLMPMRSVDSRRMHPKVVEVLNSYMTPEAAKAQGGV